MLRRTYKEDGEVQRLWLQSSVIWQRNWQVVAAKGERGTHNTDRKRNKWLFCGTWPCTTAWLTLRLAGDYGNRVETKHRAQAKKTCRGVPWSIGILPAGPAHYSLARHRQAAAASFSSFHVATRTPPAPHLLIIKPPSLPHPQLPSPTSPLSPLLRPRTVTLLPVGGSSSSLLPTNSHAHPCHNPFCSWTQQPSTKKFLVQVSSSHDYFTELLL